MDQSALAEVWGKCRARACDGQFDITVYELRHTAATLKLRHGAKGKSVARQLGNSESVIYRTYSRFMPDETNRSGTPWAVSWTERQRAGATEDRRQQGRRP